MPVDWFSALCDPIFNDNMDVGLADRIMFGSSQAISMLVLRERVKDLKAANPDRYSGLKGTGFDYEEPVDIMAAIKDRNGGVYLDQGALAMIQAGKVRNVL